MLHSIDDSSPRLVHIPKPGGGERELTLLGHTDDHEYRGAVSAVVDRVDASFGPGVLADRLHPAWRNRDHWFRPWRGARSRFRSAVRCAASRPGTVVFAADVHACFPSIHGPAIERALLGIGAHPSQIGRIRRVLDRFAEFGVTGLPVGPAPSAVLAGAVLGAVDRAVAREGVRHLRWVDDFVVVAPGERAAAGALGRLVDSLGESGLAPAPEKLRLLDAASSSVSHSRGA